VTQVHGADILVIDEQNSDYDHFLRIECDGIITNQPGVMIAVGVADCVPILLLDPVKRVVAALHAGWQGTVAAIARKGVESMVNMFGANHHDILAAIGPAIGPCCYEVDGVVRDAFLLNSLDWDSCVRSRGEGKWGLDLGEANRQQLLQAGILPGNLESSDHCVSCLHDWFFSYRRDRGETGRQMGFIMLKQ
jgi:YfiH family protein